MLGPLLFIVFINDLPEEVDSTVYLFADDTKIYRQIATTGDVSILQSDIDNLFNWSSTWLLRFHPDKCKALHISNRSSSAGGVYTMNKYEGGSVTLEEIKNEKDIGVTMDTKLQFEEHIHIQIKKANMMMGIIRRSFAHLDMETFCLLYKALVRPHLEYASSVWNPYKKKLIEEIENVQRRATKLVPGLSNLPYEERLRKLDLPTLKFRRMRGDMIEVFKITSGKYDSSVCKDLFEQNTTSSTRGHTKKFIKKRARLDIRKYYFTNRVIDLWNKLPENVISAKSVISFEGRLDSIWKEHPMKYDYTCDYKSICYTGKSEINSDAEEEPNIEGRASLCVRNRHR